MTVDAHHHLWHPVRAPQPWIRPEQEAIAGAFEPHQLEPLLAAYGIERTILVQAANTDADTDYLFAHAKQNDWIAAVTAWIPLASPERAVARLEALATHPQLRAIRHLIHQEDDPHWILRPEVLESLAVVESRGLLLELPCVFPRHLEDVPELARSFPRMTIVVDHLGKPPLGTDAMARWAVAIRYAAGSANVVAKISGLNTCVDRGNWGARDLQPAVKVAVDCFGPDRLMSGSDWPVCLLNGDYGKVWEQTVQVIRSVAPDDAERILGETATGLYRLEGR